ncbi:MAG: hypothetical protein G01um101418_326 [Parcubacteria group bacterium Gr01-1014_18]|nr:MAG: hypothetical protein Greene041636_298 [Parcubacteria group bacterium Greene0416_36]TSC81186.1 MAG: hypothetical protein G01um101418_326 [Parcubacteria group bacterium Gr01-1014_18]TSC99183.1 MAG: hypothetical protein Greene101420_328 [Parcubacteria group bacterium Greene1014_20]TSD07459.1 MAG: hypothetical protein Greene07142_158 [Parcubacteria group bacterium Greene0714_2]
MTNSEREQKLNFWDLIASIFWLLMESFWMMQWNTMAQWMIPFAIITGLYTFRYIQRTIAAFFSSLTMFLWVTRAAFWVVSDINKIMPLEIVAKVLFGIGTITLVVLILTNSLEHFSRFKGTSHNDQSHKLNLAEQSGSVVWFLMDGLWLMKLTFWAYILIIPALVLNLTIFRYTERKASGMIVTTIINLWLLFAISWMISDLGGITVFYTVSQVCFGCMGVSIIALIISLKPATQSNQISNPEIAKGFI